MAGGQVALGFQQLSELMNLEGITVLGPLPESIPVSYTHLRAHETVLDLVCRLLLEKKTRRTPKALCTIYHPALSVDL